ncbi:Na(+)-translocating NADH-quinone reductase subunit A [Bythopirellula polymerisocia]|uniref:Na(+)-translocating NADH-quinone reductase subunit A n=1 Tax=Bythopirellula polymerisocia TaxID=2528003 RepID=A0A5C6C9Y0_9BACT|nr:Na(+)-translocating NADH-quinone reductase subunit A [Bythopirellula polymerisocia]TWU20885.1 Na(+)-translocating NADH-quinone reductase subunit A [Bythopirellula polymerisocia]
MTSVHQIAKGLDLPIEGEPAQAISESPVIRHVALVASDYVGMKPTMLVSEGDHVKLGQAVFTDKKTPGVQFTSPAAGKVVGVNRGAKRKFLSLVIEIEGEDQEKFAAFPDQNLTQLDRKQICEQLVASGMWTALRTRPFSKVPVIDSVPNALFITAVDTNPLAPDPSIVIAERPADFVAGLEVLSRLSDGPTYVCRKAASEIPGEGKTPVEFHAFDGPHPSGLVGTHIHTLMPVDRSRTVWHIGYQDVIAVGHLFLTGELLTERVVSIAGPVVNSPRLVRTRIGASLEELTAWQFTTPSRHGVRVISGSVLSGRRSVPPIDFLGRFHNQVTLLAEGGERDFLGWMKPGADKFSVRRVFASAWSSVAGNSHRFKFDTGTEGSPRAIVPIGMYEQVMPLDIIATPLLKSLTVGDSDFAQQLGVLELDEEDLALCTYVDPGKHEFGPLLRDTLTKIEVEG